MNGRGVLGRFGPNHAVDNGVLTLKEDNNGDIKLHALGILRKFDGDVPALAGGFAEYSKNDDGGYTFNIETTNLIQRRKNFSKKWSADLLNLCLNIKQF